MPIISELNKLLESFILEDVLNEKIMTKKEARRRKLRAKRKAQKQAQEKDVIKPEIIDDENNKKDDFKPLVIYNEKLPNNENISKDYSENFKKFIQAFNDIIQKYGPIFAQAENEWQRIGKDKPCPSNAHEIFKQGMEDFKQDIRNLLETILPQLAEDMYEEELIYIETQMTAINRFTEEYEKAITAANPKDLPIEIENKNLFTTTDKKTQSVTKERKVEGKDLITYKNFGKLVKQPKEVWKKVVESEKKLTQIPWSNFIENLNPLNWFDDTLWNFIESPVVTDFIKTLAYSNPFTAFIYDGKLGNLGFKADLQKIKDYIQKKHDIKDKTKESKKKKSEDFYNERGIPVDLSKLKASELRAEFYGNKHFVDMLNTAYNHPETDIEDAKILEKLAISINKQFMNNGEYKDLEKVNRSQVIKDFTELCIKLNEIADYQKWNDEKSFKKAKKEANKDMRAKTLKDSKNSEESQKIQKINNLIRAYKNDDQKTWSDTEIADKLTSKYTELSIDKALEYVKNWIDNNKQESYNGLIKNLNKLLETAEA